MTDQSPQPPVPAQPPVPPPPVAPPPPGYGYPAYAPPAQRTNVMAILSLVFAFVFSILGIVFGHIALNQIKRTGEEGHGLALAGLIIGYVVTGLFVLFWVAYILFFVILFGTIANTGMYYS